MLEVLSWDMTMRHVLARQVSELIHKSEAHMNLPSCKVSVHFVQIQDKDENGEEYEIVEGSEVEVSRAAFSDNTNKYYINGKGSNYKEVTDLLKQAGIDLDHNRFLILQGEVELISLMPPKARNENENGMLEYLEDIIGSNRLIEKIEESAKEVDVLNEERGQKVNKLKIVEKERANLGSAKEEAEEYMQQQRKLVIKKSVLYQLHLKDVGAELEVHTAKKAQLEEKLAEEKEKVATITKEVESITAEYTKEKEGYEAMAGEMDRVKSEFAVFERKDIKFKEDIKHLKAKDKKVRETVVKEQDKADKARESIPKQEKAITEAEATIAKMEKLIPDETKVLDKMYEATKGETDALRVKLEKAQEELVPWTKASNEAQSNCDLVKGEIELVMSKANKAKEALANAKQVLADADPKRKDKQKAIKEKQAQLAKTKKQVEESKDDLHNNTEKEAVLREDVKKMRGQLEDSRSAQQASKSTSNVLKVLMDAKKSGKVIGIHGRLGDLGSIDDKYDVAVTTACGALNNIVVENTAVAQYCCDLLRKSGAGVATFIMLDKQQHLMDKMSLGKGSFPSDRLFDLVKPKDAKFLPAFYFALRDTLVAPNLDNAMKIAYGGKQRFRVVTLDGSVIDTSGTMSGGGNKVSRGGMSSKPTDDVVGLSPKELDALEKKLAAASDELTSTRTKVQQLERAVEQGEAECQRLQGALSKLEMELDALAKEEAETRENLKVFEAEANANVPDDKKCKALMKQLEEAETELAKARDKSDKAESKCKALQEEILNAGGEKLRLQKKKVEGMKVALEEATSLVSKGKVVIKSAHKAVEKAEAAAKAAEEEIGAIAKELEQVRADHKAIEEAALSVMEAYKQLEEQLEEKKACLTAMDKEFEKHKAVVTKARSAQVDVENELQDATKAFEDAKMRSGHWQQKLALLREEYERDVKEMGDLQISVEEDAPEDAAAGGEGDAAMAEGKESADEAARRKVFELSPEALARHTVKNIKYEITMLEETMQRMNPNMAAIAEWRRKDAEFKVKQEELDLATERRDKVRAAHDALRKQRLDEFMAGFSVISMRLKEMYQMITLGGDAELELVDSLDPFSEGIVFSVRPPKKSWKNISNLSGGEKTLSSLSLVFALHHYKPTPLYVMDEIDAALDFKNVSIVANYIKERTKNAQFIIISLRNNMFELADRLVGIYKTHHCTKSVTINPAMLAAHLPATPGAPEVKVA